MDIKAFVNVESDDRLMRIIRRNILESGRDYEKSLRRYEDYMKIMHQQFIEYSKRFADVAVPQEKENNVAIMIFLHEFGNNYENKTNKSGKNLTALLVVENYGICLILEAPTS